MKLELVTVPVSDVRTGMQVVCGAGGVKVVLQGATFTLNPGEKAGLVGRNGAGKSSLFSLLANRLPCVPLETLGACTTRDSLRQLRVIE